MLADDPGHGSATQPGEDCPGVTVRLLESQADLDACVELQRETWGANFTDVVPGSVILVTSKIGGVAAGAFDADGGLLGFVYGITGSKDGQPAHWSHMLAVREEFRDRGIGCRLKLFQRDWLIEHQIPVMYWTFDPLVARNAHLNLNKLRAGVSEYAIDMYGNSSSDLHRLGTDRLIVTWRLLEDAGAPDRRRREAKVKALAETSPIMNGPGSEDGGGGAGSVAAHVPVRIEIPPDIHAVEASSFSEALGWRESTRRAFGEHLGNGRVVTGFFRDEATNRCFYVLESSTPEGSPLTEDAS